MDETAQQEPLPPVQPAPIDYAAAAPVSRKPYFFVLQSGIITTVLALAGIYWLNKNTDDFNIMGWYANYVIPVGAILVGAVAGAGYGIASWYTGVRISRGLLLAVVAMQACAYVAAEYVEYRDVIGQVEERRPDLKAAGRLPGFFQYYDMKAKSFAWKGKYSKKEGEALGGWGYFFVLLGAAGFILSGLIAPAALFAVPYCDTCQRYKSTKLLGVLPASVPEKKISKSDTAAKEAQAAEQADAGKRADDVLDRLRTTSGAADLEAFRAELAAAGDRKANAKLPRRVEVQLVWCKLCNSGHLAPSVVSGKGDKVVRTKLATTELSPEFVRGIL